MIERNNPRVPTQELALVDYVERIDRFRAGRVGVKINLSQLATPYRRENYIRIAKETFVSGIKIFDGHLFVMKNSDIIFIARNASFAALDPIVNRLRVLFSGDPLIQFNDNSGTTKFCDWYKIETDYDLLHDTAEKYLKQAEEHRYDPDADIVVENENLLTPIRPELLAKLELALEKADVSNVVRRQTVCTLFEGKPPQPLFEELYVSIEDLQNITTPGVDLLANRWLFQYLTQTLDKRVIMMLIRDGVRGDRPFSLNLNVATILSPEFMRFEEIISPQLRGRLVIEMNKIDVFSDMGAFLFARDYLRDHGFRICLDGLTHHTLAYYDRSHLGFDLMKVYWTPDSIDNMLPEMMPMIRNVVMEAGQARTILCRCENAHAVDIGQQLGIVMFQGRHVERVLTTYRNSNLTASGMPSV
ncbi:MAG: hypothetical protein PHX43_02980 [Alphaproteobacteria bacterium]|nr:hypothetical protein [Alphaproteobacteria bacterium]